MVTRIAIVFAGIIVAGVFLNLYYLVATFFTAFLLGIDSALFLSIEYWICFAAGVVTSFCVMRTVWPKDPTRTKENGERGDELDD